jgi:hypothetical protein
MSDDTKAPETFEEALAFAIRALTEAVPPLASDWLDAFDREREKGPDTTPDR